MDKSDVVCNVAECDCWGDGCEACDWRGYKVWFTEEDVLAQKEDQD